MVLIFVEGKVFKLNIPTEDVTKETILSIIKDLDQEVFEDLTRFDWSYVVREDKIIVVRKSAVFG